MKLPMYDMVFDPQLLGGPFAAPTFDAHRALVAGVWGGPMTAEQRVMWDEMAGGRAPLAIPPRLLVIIKSRRTGMTQLIGGAVAPALALSDWPHVPGEEPKVVYLGSDRKQSSIAHKRSGGSFEASPRLACLVRRYLTDRIELTNGNVLEIGTADSASVRGDTLACGIVDEACYVGNLAELLAALRPALATTPGSLLILFSTPRGADGPVYELYKRFWGVEDPDTLVLKAHVRTFNPTIPESFIQRELELDPFMAPAEWDCVFISGLASFLDSPLIDSNTRSEPRELPRVGHLSSGAHIRYLAGLDVSGGRSDAAAAAVSHRDGQRIVVDAVRRWPAPHDPAQVARSVAEFLSVYGLHSAVADQYGAELSRTIYAEAGVSLTSASVTRSEAYLHLLPLLTTGRVELPPDPRLRTELLGLERRVARSGKDSVDHRPGAHDDVANAAALAAWAANRGGATSANRVITSHLTTAAGPYGPQPGRERIHPADRRETDSIWQNMQNDLL